MSLPVLALGCVLISQLAPEPPPRALLVDGHEVVVVATVLEVVREKETTEPLVRLRVEKTLHGTFALGEVNAEWRPWEFVCGNETDRDRATRARKHTWAIEAHAGRRFILSLLQEDGMLLALVDTMRPATSEAEAQAMRELAKLVPRFREKDIHASEARAASKSK